MTILGDKPLRANHARFHCRSPRPAIKDCNDKRIQLEALVLKCFFPERRASSTKRVRSFLERCSARKLDQNTMDIAAAMVLGVLRAIQRETEGIGRRAFCFSRRNRVYEIRRTEIVAVICTPISRLLNAFRTNCHGAACPRV